jgi:TonB family protein
VEEVSTQTRTGAALLVSTGAHAALLGALFFTLHPAPPSRPVAVRILELSSPEKEDAAAAAPGEARPKAALAGPARVHLPKPTRAAVEVDVVSRAPAAAQATLAAEGPMAGPSEARALSAGGAEAQLASMGLGAGLAKGGGGSRLAELHRRLAEAAARCYPSSARRFRLTGEVPLHFCLDASGVATALSLEGSTGSALLDRSALECVVQGAQPLSGFEGCFLVPVRFGG